MKYVSVSFSNCLRSLTITTALAGLVGLAALAMAPAARAGSIQTVASFSGGTNGAYPEAGVTAVGGTLYGTTLYGGTYGFSGQGTLFSYDPTSGSLTTLASFSGGTNGAYPGGVTDVGGTLYGTAGGGTAGDGTLFSYDPTSGGLTTLASFTGTNGAYPGGVTDVGGTLYGTTARGGTAGDGTLFSYDPTSGSLTTLASFSGGTNGADPATNLTVVGDTLYGTTARGGTAGDGTLFSYDPSNGDLTTLASFTGGSNGALPTAGVTDVGGTLYGTTNGGGAAGDGTLFAYQLPASSTGVPEPGSLALLGTGLLGLGLLRRSRRRRGRG